MSKVGEGKARASDEQTRQEKGQPFTKTTNTKSSTESRTRAVEGMADTNGASSSNLGKRTRDESPAANVAPAAAESSDEDVGPMPAGAGGDDSDDDAGPMPAGPSSKKNGSAAAAKKRKVLKHEKVYLDNLPNADRYYSKEPP